MQLAIDVIKRMEVLTAFKAIEMKDADREIEEIKKMFLEVEQ